jgi:hypothetical protein
MPKIVNSGIRKHGDDQNYDFKKEIYGKILNVQEKFNILTDIFSKSIN